MALDNRPPQTTLETKDPSKRLSIDYFANKSPGEKSFEDLSITDDIWEMLKNEEGVDLTEIEIDVKDGVVLVTGTVSTVQLKGHVEHAIINTVGVKDLRSELHVLKKFPDAEV
jgi:osmotically-inducible protein OsmY